MRDRTARRERPGERRQGVRRPCGHEHRAGAYKWVVRYNGDTLHAAGATGCNDPAGAFAVVAPPAVSASFGTAEIAVGDSTALTFTIVTRRRTRSPLKGVALEDSLPPGLAVASPSGLSGSCGGRDLRRIRARRTLSLDNGTIAGGLELQLLGGRERLGSGTGDDDHGSGGIGERRRRQHRHRVAHRARTRSTRPCRRRCPARPSSRRVRSRRARWRRRARSLREQRRSWRSRARPRISSCSRRMRPGGGCAPRRSDSRGCGAAGHHPRAARANRRGAGHRARGRVLRGDRAPRAAPRRPHHALLRRAGRPALHPAQAHAPADGARLTANAATITISGQVAPPLGKPIRRVVITRLSSCAAGDEVVARVRPGPRGRFRVTLPRAPGAGPALYRGLTHVRTKGGAPLKTTSLILWEA